MPVYVEPQPLVAVSDHKTLEMESVRLAHDIDPRKLPTELRLARPSRIVPDSDWPQADVVAVRSQPPSSHPPLAARRNWRTPLVLLVLLAALTLLVLAIVMARRSPAAQNPSAAVPSETSLPAPVATVVLPSPLPPPEAPPSVSPALSAMAEPAVAEPAVAEPAVAEPAPKPTPVGHGSVKSNIHLGSDAASRAPAVPTASKPKRAIY